MSEDLLARGKRGEVFLTDKNTVIKRLRPSSKAIHAIELEAHYLKKANELGLGPKLIRSTPDEIEMEYIDGERIDVYLEKASEKEKITIFNKILKQLELLDTSGLAKQELTNPYKHIIIRNKEPILIDWERCRFTENPKNVNQFKEYMKKFS